MLSRYVVFVASVNRDVVSLGSLQDESHKVVGDVVHVEAPGRRGVQHKQNPGYYGVSNQFIGGESQKPYPSENREQRESQHRHGKAGGPPNMKIESVGSPTGLETEETTSWA